MIIKICRDVRAARRAAESAIRRKEKALDEAVQAWGQLTPTQQADARQRLDALGMGQLGQWLRNVAPRLNRQPGQRQ